MYLLNICYDYDLLRHRNVIEIPRMYSLQSFEGNKATLCFKYDQRIIAKYRIITSDIIRVFVCTDV